MALQRVRGPRTAEVPAPVTTTSYLVLPGSHALQYLAAMRDLHRDTAPVRRGRAKQGQARRKTGDKGDAAMLVSLMQLPNKGSPAVGTQATKPSRVSEHDSTGLRWPQGGAP
jgi:hypothetical protein